ncbi:MAG: hypothetical protein WD048_10455 [Chitinophagales bacterium]
MMQKKWFFLIFLILAGLNTWASEVFTFRDSSGTPLLHVSDALIKNEKGRILYNIQGNIIFSGTGEKRKDILLMLKSENIFSKKSGEVLGQKKGQVIYFTYGGGYYIRPSEQSTETLLLAYWQKNKAGGFSLYHGKNDSLLAFYPDQNAKDVLLTALFHYFQTSNAMSETLVAAYEPPDKTVPDVTNTSGTIRRMWGGGNQEFEWDGYVLRRRWGNNPMQEWTYDGLILRRVWSSSGNEEFIWENNILRRRWYTSKDEFVWNGRTIRRRYGPEQEEYIIQGTVVKSMWTESDANQWAIDGEIPVPVIAMVIYGLVNR